MYVENVIIGLANKLIGFVSSSIRTYTLHTTMCTRRVYAATNACTQFEHICWKLNDERTAWYWCKIDTMIGFIFELLHIIVQNMCQYYTAHYFSYAHSVIFIKNSFLSLSHSLCLSSWVRVNAWNIDSLEKYRNNWRVHI